MDTVFCDKPKHAIRKVEAKYAIKRICHLNKTHDEGNDTGIQKSETTRKPGNKTLVKPGMKAILCIHVVPSRHLESNRSLHLSVSC